MWPICTSRHPCVQPSTATAILVGWLLPLILTDHYVPLCNVIWALRHILRCYLHFGWLDVTIDSDCLQPISVFILSRLGCSNLTPICLLTTMYLSAMLSVLWVIIGNLGFEAYIEVLPLFWLVGCYHWFQLLGLRGIYWGATSILVGWLLPLIQTSCNQLVGDNRFQPLATI